VLACRLKSLLDTSGRGPQEKPWKLFPQQTHPHSLPPSATLSATLHPRTLALLFIFYLNVSLYETLTTTARPLHLSSVFCSFFTLLLHLVASTLCRHLYLPPSMQKPVRPSTVTLTRSRSSPTRLAGLGRISYAGTIQNIGAWRWGLEKPIQEADLAVEEFAVPKGGE
jgi:hypothetical protein